MAQINTVTKSQYTASNLESLESIQRIKGYASSEWCTFVQARNEGKRVRKGEHGVKLWRVIEVIDNQGKLKKTIIHFTVFNTEQLETV